MQYYAIFGIMISDAEPLKPLFWVASSKEDLKDFPLDARQIMGFALFQAQVGGKHANAKPLKGFGGAGVLEISEHERGSTFRAVYTVKFIDAVYVLHAFQKKSKTGVKTPRAELDLISKRLKVAEEHYDKWRANRDEA